MYLGTPILEKYQTPATSFVIASYWNSRDMLYGYSSDYLTFESHSYQMHQGGGNIGHGGIYTENAKVFPGDNPYLLPRVRMLGTQTLDEFISAIQ